MPITEYESVGRTLVEPTCGVGPAKTRREQPSFEQGRIGATAASLEDLMEIAGKGAADSAALRREVERLRELAEEAAQKLAASERRVAELDALCQARHAGLQIVLAQLQSGEQQAKEAERALKREVSDLSFQLQATERAYEVLTRSLSWRCTAPLRWIASRAPARR